MLNRKKKSPAKPAEELGLRCPGCNCADTPVLYTRKTRGGLRRMRQCRHCKRRFTTREQC